jgi:hypothetical protein
MRDLTDAPEEQVAAERAKVATEGWGAALLEGQGADGFLGNWHIQPQVGNPPDPAVVA